MYSEWFDYIESCKCEFILYIFILYIFNFQLPIIDNCIFCIDQYVLVHRKVIKDYFAIAKNRIEIINISMILRQLIKISNSLFEYIKTSDEQDRMKAAEKIDRIKK